MQKWKTRWCEFCTGNDYALLVCVLVLVGYVTHAEFYLNIINFLLLTVSLILCDSIRPFAIFHLVFIFQVPLAHSPSAPFYSTYYTEPPRLIAMGAVAALFVGAFLYYLIRTHFFRDIFRQPIPFRLPLLLLCAAFLTNGLFATDMRANNFGFAWVQIAVFLLDFLVLWHGFRAETADETADYAITAAIFIAYLIIGELISKYLTHLDEILNDNFYKGTLMFGWGTPNAAAILLVMLIPVLFCGVCRGTHPKLCYVTAVLTFIMTVMTLSRGATVIGMVIFLASLIVTFKKRHADPFLRRTTYLLLAGTLIFCLIFGKPLFTKVLSAHFFMGLSDNGRFSMWREALAAFLTHPVFGVGFYNLKLTEYQVFAAFYPDFAHNTLIQMLSTCGLFGFAAYLYYRIETVKIFLRKPTVEKTLFGLSALALLLGSQLDIFVFMIYPMFFFNFVLVAGIKLDREKALPVSDAEQK